ncbi:MAG: ABC transporter ATP-binding protein, partial [Flavobacteriales bacterium]|nr:ABC transporter ATP-binding protein [Flavobacteriales bacterium]
MGKFSQILSLVKNYRLQVIMAFIYNFLNAILSLFTFAALAPILRIIFQVTDDEPTAPVMTSAFSFKYYYELLCYKLDVYIENDNAVLVLTYICIFTVTLALVKNFVYYLGLRNIAFIRTAVIRDLRKHIYDHMIRLSLGYFTNERKGDIMSRLTNDLMEVEVSVIGAVESLVKSPIMVIASLAFLFAIDWRLTLFALIFLPLSGYLISRVAKSLKNAARRGKDALGVLMSVIEETLSGIRIVKAFNAEDEMTERFDGENENYYRLMMRLYRREYLASPMSEFISIIVISILLFVGGQLILTAGPDGQFMDGSLFVVYLIVFSQIIPPARSLSDAIFKINKGSASIDRI